MGLRELVWRWDPIGVSDDPEWPRDEYDCLVGPLMRLLEDQSPPPAIAAFLEHEVVEHFGLDPAVHDFGQLALEFRAWFEAEWRNTRV